MKNSRMSHEEFKRKKRELMEQLKPYHERSMAQVAEMMKHPLSRKQKEEQRDRIKAAIEAGQKKKD